MGKEQAKEPHRLPLRDLGPGMCVWWAGYLQVKPLQRGWQTGWQVAELIAGET